MARSTPSIAVLGATVAAGVLSLLALLGVVFTTVLETSLTNVVGVVSPIAFVVLAFGGGISTPLLPIALVSKR